MKIHENSKTLHYQSRCTISNLVKNAINEPFENSKIEFKASFLWNIELQQPDKFLILPIIKNICAFMNCKGGKIFIGVSDKGEAVGLDNDLEVLKKHKSKVFQKGIDGLQIYIKEKINSFFDFSVADEIEFDVLEQNGKNYLALIIQPSRKPIVTPKNISKDYKSLRGDDKKENYEEKFFVRIGPAVEEYSSDIKKLSEYIFKRTKD